MTLIFFRGGQNRQIRRLVDEFSQLRSLRFLDELSVLSLSLNSHNCKNSSTILEFAYCVGNAESSKKSNNPSNFLDLNSPSNANSQNLR